MMLSEKLVEPVSDAYPAGEEGVYTLAFQELTALAEYLAARLELAEVERLAKIDYQGDNAESDLRAAQANAEDARRKVERCEASAREAIQRAPSPEIARQELRMRAERMLQETGKDLRVAQHLALALLLEEGVAGLAAGFRTIAALMERYGADLHPKPDEDDPQDVSAREMVVSEMLNGDAFVHALRESAVLQASGVGRFTGRDAEVIDGKLEDDRSGPRSVAEIAAIAQAGAGSEEGGNEAVRAAVAQVEECERAARAVIARFNAGSLHGDRVPRLLQRMRNLLVSAIQADGAVAAPAESTDKGGIAPIQTLAPGQRGNASAGGPLRSREDARRLILQISKFLEETEPSHPAPFFLKRAERLLGAKDFFAIMRDMAPEAISEMERITGHRESGSESY